MLQREIVAFGQVNFNSIPPIVVQSLYKETMCTDSDSF